MERYQTDYKPFKLRTMNHRAFEHLRLGGGRRFGYFALNVLLFFLLSSSLSAQPDLCIEFEDMALGSYGPSTGYMAGDLVYEEGGVGMYLEVLHNPNGIAVDLGELIASDAPLPFTGAGLNGTYLMAANASMVFHFGGLPNPVGGVVIPYYDAGGFENISVNGGEVWVANTPDDFPGNVAPGVELSIEHPVNAPDGSGLIVLIGEIESVLIGGQEFFFDYVCLQEFPSCLIFNVEAEAFSCDGEGFYEILVHFDHVGTGGDGFVVEVSDEVFGPFDYADLPVTVGPIPGFGVLPVELVVRDVANPDCGGLAVLDPVDCSDLCLDFEDIEPGTLWGSAAGNEPGDVVYDAEGVLMSVHSLLLPGGPDVFGNVLFDQAPVSPPDAPVFGIAGLTSGINLGFDFTLLDYPVSAVRIGFAYQGGINNISFNDGDVFIFESFTELPDLIPGAHVVLFPNPPSGTAEIGYLFLISDGAPIEHFVLGGQELILDNLCLFLSNEPPACSISQLDVQQMPCLADGQFFVQLSFDHEGTGNFGFNVHGNGQDYGTFSYDDLPVMIGPLSGDGNLFYEFVVQDVEFPDCGDFFELGTVSCSDQCVEMEDLEVGTVYGSGVGMQPGDVAFVEDDVSVTLDSFVYFNGTSGFLNATVDNGSFGPPGNPLTGNYLFVSNINLVFDFTGLAEPVTSVAFGFVDGGGEENFAVNGGELFVLNDFFELPLQNIPGFEVMVFPAPDSSTNSGYVIINGPIETLTIGGQELGLDNICFVTAPPCAIAGLEAEFLENTDDGLLYLINFAVAGTAQEHFDLFYNGEFLGFFNLSDLPLEVVLPCMDLPEGEITVCMNDLPDCCASLTVDMSPCLPCHLYDLTLEPLGCDSSGFFMVEVDFQHEGQGTGFKMKAGGEIFGPYDYADLPVVIGPFPGDGASVYPLVVRDLSDPHCTLTGLFGPVDCQIGCLLYDVSLDFIVQDGDALVYLLDFEAINPDSDHFDVHFNGAYLGTFAYADLPLELILPCTNLPEGELVLCDSEAPDCCTAVVVDMSPCAACAIGELVIEPHPCQAGEFYFDLDFPHQNGAAAGFKVVVNGQNMGVHNYADLPLTLGPLAGDGSTVYHVIVRDLEDPHCLNDGEFGPVDCDQPCEEPQIYAEILGENDEGILVEIGGLPTNPADGSVDVYVEGLFVGTFGNFPVDAVVLTLPCGLPSPVAIALCWHEQPDCCTFIELDLPDCENCHIYNLEAEHTLCDADGNFFVLLNFDYINVGDQFKVMGNGTNYGLFNYADLPIELGPFAGDGTTVYEFVVSDVADPSCSNYTELGPVDCSLDCSIFDLTATPGDCAADGTYSLTIDFAYQNPGNLFFDVTLDGEYLGFFPLADLPITIDSILPGTEPTAHVLVCINDNPSCCEDTHYEVPACLVFNEIWPGDANKNGEADYDDLLNIGLAYGSTGPARSSQDINWEAHFGEDWPQFFANNALNYKFADCNGDGVIDGADLEAIEQNYGLTYIEPTPVPAQEASETDPPIYLSLPVSLPNGQPLEANIVVGTEDIPVDALYGLSFKIQFDPQVIIPSSVDITFEDSWLAAGDELISIDRTLLTEGMVEVAVSRIDQTDVGGFGAMAQFVGIIDDVLGKGEMSINILDVHALRADESPVPLYKLPAQTDISTSVKTPSPADGIQVFPNPVSDWLYFHLPQGVHISRVWMYDARGQRQLLSLDGQKLNMSKWPFGVYYLQIETVEGDLVYRKVVK